MTTLVGVCTFFSCGNSPSKTKKVAANNSSHYVVSNYMTICGLEGISFCYILENEKDGSILELPEDMIQPMSNYYWGYKYNLECIEKEFDEEYEDRFSSYFEVKKLIKQDELILDPFVIPISNSAACFLKKENNEIFLLHKNVNINPDLNDELDKLILNPRLAKGQFMLVGENNNNLKLIKII